MPQLFPKLGIFFYFFLLPKPIIFLQAVPIHFRRVSKKKQLAMNRSFVTSMRPLIHFLEVRHSLKINLVQICQYSFIHSLQNQVQFAQYACVLRVPFSLQSVWTLGMTRLYYRIPFFFIIFHNKRSTQVSSFQYQ